MQRVVGSPEVRSIEPAALVALVEQQGVVVVDNNPERRWAAGHVPTAINLDPADYRREDLTADDLDTPLVFYCSGPGCGASHYATKRAVTMGFRNAHVMPGGITAWHQAGLPTERSSPGHSPRNR
jgi:rhodanese-related sulfurtransferase